MTWLLFICFIITDDSLYRCSLYRDVGQTIDALNCCNCPVATCLSWELLIPTKPTLCQTKLCHIITFLYFVDSVLPVIDREWTALGSAFELLQCHSLHRFYLLLHCAIHAFSFCSSLYFLSCLLLILLVMEAVTPPVLIYQQLSSC